MTNYECESYYIPSKKRCHSFSHSPHFRYSLRALGCGQLADLVAFPVGVVGAGLVLKLVLQAGAVAEGALSVSAGRADVCDVLPGWTAIATRLAHSLWTAHCLVGPCQGNQ